ncbi:MAG: aldo/keto reductase [Myxococcaceae bacterium]|nr:aldo/keto reductase [Myxococcaceae bacterium]
MLGLGAMRLSTDPARELARSRAVLARALELGVAWVDTARAYALGEDELGHNEVLVGEALRAHPGARVSTKGGMARPGGQWRPDARAASLERDCDESLRALGVPVDLYLLHAPDPRVPFATSVRALRRQLDEKKVKAIGLCNVSRAQLVEALDLAPIAAVQLAVSPLELTALRGGVVDLALERGLLVFAHSPFGGPRRRGALQAKLGDDAHRRSLAALLGRGLIPLPGPTRLETVESLADVAPAAQVDVERLLPRPRRAPAAPIAVTLLMGLPGSGKTTAAKALVNSGLERLNRDEAGGTLDSLHRRLDERLGAGSRGLVLDNTYLTRASRQAVLAIAARHGVGVLGRWLELPPALAQRRVVERMLEVHGRLLEPRELAKGRTPDTLGPRSFLRMAREVEPPGDDEGFTRLEREQLTLPPGAGAAATFASLEAEPTGPVDFVLAWKPGATAESLAATVQARFGAKAALWLCPHPEGPPTCWCRPPFPGLALAAARAHGVALERSTLLGTGPAMRALAQATGLALRET